MLRLPAPSHLMSRVSGWHMAIHAPGDSGDQVAELAGSCGCPARVRPKIAACITHSERYDCVISSSVALSRVDWFVREIENLGGHVVVTDVEELRKIA